LEPIMSDEGRDRPDADAWAKASAEDIAAEHARRREQTGQGSAAEELRRFAEAVGDAVGERLAALRNPAVQVAAQGMLSQMRSVVEPIKERNPEVFDHLTAAGAELLAAYRSAVAGAESRWTSGEGSARSTAEHIDLD
jgi:predicted NBD/HSP70 family sugar kinase